MTFIYIWSILKFLWKSNVDPMYLFRKNLVTILSNVKITWATQKKKWKWGKRELMLKRKHMFRKHGMKKRMSQSHKSLADLGGGVRDARPPLGVQILSISCSFRENLACSRPPWRVHAPPSGKSWIRHCKSSSFPFEFNPR